MADSVSGNLSYTYDDRFDALASETSPTGTVSYAHYANGLRQSVTPSGGSLISYQFDAADRLSTLSQAAGSGSALPAHPLTVGLTYDNANRRQSLTLPNTQTLTYGWDDADQLKSLIWKQTSGTTVGDLAYDYDKLGRRTQISGSFARTNPITPVSLAVGGDGRIASENGTALQYDGNGRLTQDAQYRYVWNDLGQLSEVHNLGDNALRASYRYDASGLAYPKIGRWRYHPIPLRRA